MLQILLLTIVLIFNPAISQADTHYLSFNVVNDPSDVLSSSAPDVFEQWVRCMREPQAEGCGACRDHAQSGEAEVDHLTQAVGRRCIPSDRDQAVLFGENMTPEMESIRDGHICKCFARREGTPSEMNSYNAGVDSDARVAELNAAGERALQTDFGNDLQNRLRTERIIGIFSTMTFVDESEDALEVARKYAKVEVDSRPVSSAVVNTVLNGVAVANAGINASVVHASVLGKTEVNQAETVDRLTAEASREEVSLATFNTAEMPESICMPYRHFIANKQFPTSPVFYQGLQRYGNEPDDWNYGVLMDRLLAAGKDDLEEAMNRDPDIRYAHARVEFLHHNPVFKNIFMSQDVNIKNELIGKLRRMPVCNNSACRQSPAWIRGMNEFRQSMAGFLAREEVIAAAAQGAAVSGRYAYNLTARDARIRARSSRSLLDGDKINDPAQWRGFCRVFDETTLESNGLDFLARIEHQFGQRNIGNIAGDSDFQSLNDTVCNAQRRNRRGQQMNFNRYLETTCPAGNRNPLCAPEKRGELLAQFFDNFNTPVEPSDQQEIASMLPFFRGEVGGPGTISASDVRTFNEITRNPELNERPVVFQSREYANLTPAANRTESVSRSTASVTNTAGSSNSASASQPLNPGPASASPDQVFVPSGVASTAAPVQRSEVTPRAQLEQGELEARQIREEISSLRNVMSRSPSDDSSSQAFQDLNQRLAQLESRLSQKERENNNLRRQLEEERVGPRSEVAAASSSSDDESSSSRRQSGSSQSQFQAPQGGVSAGVSSAALNNGVASLSGNSAGASSGGPLSSRSRSLVPNLALLSKYGVQSVSEQGALIVAASSSGIDYSALEAQTANSILPLSVTPEEFNLLASNDQSALNKYLDQVRAVPGDVVRINLTGGENQSMELYVVKTGGQISIVQGPDAAERSRAPASVDERQVRLSDLLNELRN